jgi:hypothetical protein
MAHEDCALQQQRYFARPMHYTDYTVLWMTEYSIKHFARQAMSWRLCQS